MLLCVHGGLPSDEDNVESWRRGGLPSDEDNVESWRGQCRVMETRAALDAAALVHALHGHRAVPLVAILSIEKG
jgi:hypothetical protein